VLRFLSLGKNNLTGSIPDSWASLVANAQEVDLSSNRLWGSLGSPWVNASTLRDGANNWTLNAVRLRYGSASIASRAAVSCASVDPQAWLAPCRAFAPGLTHFEQYHVMRVRFFYH
jgi:hypothetical protein